MRRREFIGLLGSAITSAAWPTAIRAQARATVGMLLVFSREAGLTFTGPIRSYLETLGYSEGRNVAFDFRFADGKAERLPALATELVAQRPAVIATFGDATARAVQAATSSIPIVAMSEDLVRANIVADMRRPEGNTTGLSIMGTELDAKRLELLAEILPQRSSVLLLSDPTTHRESRPALDATARALGLTLREATVGSPDEIDQALGNARRDGYAGVNVLSSALLFALRGRIIARAAGLSLPAMYQWPETSDEGGLVAYGPSLLGAFRQVTTILIKVLQGAKPPDIPVEQPTRFSLFVNLRTAKQLGIVVPPTILLRADKAIE
jgi:putative tryptophan/tyrosine transport system substrate-binding protein